MRWVTERLAATTELRGGDVGDGPGAMVDLGRMGVVGVGAVGIVARTFPGPVGTAVAWDVLPETQIRRTGGGGT